MFRFYIGWNNDTHKREFKKATDIFNKFNVLGFSVIKDIKGFWGGEYENSFAIEVITSEENPFNLEKAKEIQNKLEVELKQYKVLLLRQIANVY